MDTQINIPLGIHSGSLVGHLHTVTLCTVDIDEYKQFYGDVMQMTIEGPIMQTETDRAQQKSFWNIPSDIEYDLYHFYRQAVPSLLHLRVLHLKAETPKIHNSYNSYELGSFSLGFPTADAKKFDERMKAHNIGEMAPMQVGDIVRADGVPGQYLETIYHGPDYLHCVGIERVAISQLAPCDPDGLFCGPGYSALVSNDAEAEIRFYTKVLDHYTQLDAVWNASTGSALGVVEGVPDTGVESHIPNQGLGMYSFYTSSIEDVLDRAEEEETEILSDISVVNDPIVGHGKAILLKAPSGMFIEIIEKHE